MSPPPTRHRTEFMKHSANNIRNITVKVVIYSFAYNLMWNFCFFFLSLICYKWHDTDGTKSCMDFIRYSLCWCYSLSLMSLVEILAWLSVPNNIAPPEVLGASGKRNDDSAYGNTPHWILDGELWTLDQNSGYFMPLISDCKQDNGFCMKGGFL